MIGIVFFRNARESGRTQGDRSNRYPVIHEHTRERRGFVYYFSWEGEHLLHLPSPFPHFPPSPHFLSTHADFEGEQSKFANVIIHKKSPKFRTFQPIPFHFERVLTLTWGGRGRGEEPRRTGDCYDGLPGGAKGVGGRGREGGGEGCGVGDPDGSCGSEV